MMSGLLEDQRTAWVIAAVSFLLFLIGNLPWQLDDYDQAKQGFTSFQMIKEGRWLYQQTPHAHVATKPPLVAWISGGLFGLTRSWDLAWRLPSFLAAVALALLLFRSARSAYGLTAGLIAEAAFGLNLLSPRLATLVRTDMPLALVIFLIGALIWQKIRAQTEWRLRDQVYVFVLLTVAMLIKGPIVYAFLLPGIGVFEWWRRRHAVVAGVGDPGQSHKVQLEQSAWPGWWPWIASLVVFLLWVIGGILFQPGFFDEVVMREFVGRFGETIHRPQPLYFYLPHLLHKFAPWSLLMVAIALVVALLFTGSYTIWKVITGYRHHRDALAVFGRDVRREAAAHHWRYEVVSAKDEGLLLYLQKTHFIDPDHAIPEWNQGNLDALVASTEKAPSLMSRLPDATLSQVRSNDRKKEQGSDYVLLIH